MTPLQAHAVDAYRRHGSLNRAVAALKAEGLSVGRSTLSEWVRRFSETNSDNSNAVGIGEGEPIKNQVRVDGVTSPIPVDMPPMFTVADRIRQDANYLPAFRRYVDAVVNGVHPDDALQAAQKIDDDFGMLDDERDRLHDAIVKLRGDDGGQYLLMAFAEGDDEPAPDDVVSESDVDEAAVAALASALYSLEKDAYALGINDQMEKIGHPKVSDVTDPEVLQELRDEAQSAAEQIATTFRRDLRGAADRLWRSIPVANRGTVLAREELGRGLRAWLGGRTDWKSAQVLSVQSNRAYNAAVFSFARQNGGTGADGWMGYVTPDSCECNACLALVQMGLQPADVMVMLDGSLPLHPGCWHRVEWVYVGTLTSPVWSAQAPDDGG